MAKYLLAVHHREGDAVPTEDEMQLMFKQVDAFNDEVQEAGAWVFAGGLEPVDSAKVVRTEESDVVTTDGPFLESKEHLGGFWIIDADDLDAALAWAAKGSAACLGPVEVQPFADFSDVPPTSSDRREFMLSVHMGGNVPTRPQMTDEQMQESWKQMQDLEADLQQEGAWLYSARLSGPDTATLVRATDGDVVLTDGPFAESKEHMAGFYVIAADDLDEALAWGARVSSCTHMPIEVRPFQAGPDA